MVEWLNGIVLAIILSLETRASSWILKAQNLVSHALQAPFRVENPEHRDASQGRAGDGFQKGIAQHHPIR